MKKFVLLSLVCGLFINIANADVYKEKISSCNEYEMNAALDKAVYDKHAVITIVECDNGVIRTYKQPKKAVVEQKSCGCGCDKKQQVVKREYFVRETIQEYKPVVTYVPAGTYTRVKPVCDKGC
ncbi:MAG: hypothetical protein IKN73_00740 [Alphaproteobacteria bacterium]|nr:hypothetical protein [Alphaproteobacteria bacterium]